MNMPAGEFCYTFPWIFGNVTKKIQVEMETGRVAYA